MEIKLPDLLSQKVDLLKKTAGVEVLWGDIYKAETNEEIFNIILLNYFSCKRIGIYCEILDKTTLEVMNPFYEIILSNYLTTMTKEELVNLSSVSAYGPLSFKEGQCLCIITLIARSTNERKFLNRQDRKFTTSIIRRLNEQESIKLTTIVYNLLIEKCLD